MRHTIATVFIVALIASSACGQSPATRQVESQSILILPFVSPPGQQFDWIGKGVQQNLIAELSPDLRGSIVSPAGRSHRRCRVGAESRPRCKGRGCHPRLGPDYRKTDQADRTGARCAARQKPWNAEDNGTARRSVSPPGRTGGPGDPRTAALAAESSRAGRGPADLAAASV